MFEGIYSVQFSSPTTRDNGTGTVIFTGGKVYGGDQSYYYKGSLTVEGNQVSGTLQVVRHRPGESIFGPLTNFHLNLAGTVSEGSVNLQGNVVEQPNLQIRIDGTKVSDL